MADDGDDHGQDHQHGDVAVNGRDQTGNDPLKGTGVDDDAEKQHGKADHHGVFQVSGQAGNREIHDLHGRKAGDQTAYNGDQDKCDNGRCFFGDQQRHQRGDHQKSDNT